jgi:hypothetical protein
MFGYSVKLPVLRDSKDGFTLTKSIQENVQQNLKNIVLTAPGERIMDPNFGVGIRAFLFEHNIESVREDIKERIFSQVKKYMPFVQIKGVRMGEDREISEKLYIQIEYAISGLSAVDILQLAIPL